MSEALLCDRCGKPVPAGKGIIARKPRLYGVIPVEKKEMWSDFKSRIDLCDTCTKQFFSFVKEKTNGRK